MDRTTALSTAGAFTLTAAATVTALFMTVDRGANAAAEATDPVVMEPEIVTEYEVVQLQPDAPVAAEPSAADVGEIVYEVEYLEPSTPAVAGEYAEEAEEYEHEEDDDEDEDDD